MRCFVPFCRNTADSVRTAEGGCKDKEITFHSFPKEAHLRAAWLAALGKQETHLPDSAVVCSQHFLSDDIRETKSGSRQIVPGAIPSTVLVCTMCLDGDSEQILMSKYKLDEQYEEFVGLPLCDQGKLKQTLCVLCARRLVNVTKFRDDSLRSRSLMKDLIEKHEIITKRHLKIVNYTNNLLRSKLVITNLGADHWDLHIVEEEGYDSDKQTQPEDTASSGDETAEGTYDSMLVDANAEVICKQEELVSQGQYSVSDERITLESKQLDYALQKQTALNSLVADNVAKIQDLLKFENSSFECMLCFDEFSDEQEYNVHMSIHLQTSDADDECVTSQVCEPGAAVSSDWDSAHITEHRHAVPKPDDGSHSSTDWTQPTVAPLSTRFATYDENKKQATEEAGAIPKSEPILETDTDVLDDQSSQSYTKTCTDINTFTNCVVRLNDIYKKPKNPLSNKNLCVTADTAAKLYSCEICNVKCSVKHNLLRHMKTHTGDEPYSCEICNYKCSVKHNLLRHMKTHTGDKPYSCEICNYKCAYKHHLLQHIRIHTGEKPYSCEICNYKSARKSHLLQHIRIHTGEKSYSCEICNYKCAYKHYLSRHMKTHSDEKPYSCEICNYKSARNSHLLQHMRIHTGEKPFSCEICNYKSAQKSHLLQHMKIHTGEKPYTLQL